MTVLVLLRHARTEYNTEGRLQGSLDVPLGAQGRDDAAAAAARLVEAYGVPDRIVCSPLSRARETAAAVGALVPVPVVVDPRLTQRSYGEWEGLTWEQVRAGWPDEHDRRQRGLDPRIAGWDGATAVAERVVRGLEEACAGADLVLAVSHGSALQLGALALLGLDLHSTALGKLPHAHWNVLVSSPGHWSLARVGLSAEAD